MNPVRDDSNPVVTGSLPRIWNGEAGLRLTYWGLGVATVPLWRLAEKHLPLQSGSPEMALFVLGMAGFYAFVCVAIWRAAEKYQGWKPWAVLAKVTSLLAVVFVFLMALGASTWLYKHLVRITHPVQPMVFRGFAGSPGLALSGNAKVINNKDGAVLRLTPAVTSQLGSAFTSTKVSAREFSTFFIFRMSGRGGTFSDCGPPELGADGMVFVLQAVGSGLGAAGDGMGYRGIPNSIGIEFDTFCNRGLNDPNSNHVGVLRNGRVAHDSGLAVVTVSPDFDDGNLWYCWIDYDSRQLEVRLSQNGTRPEQATLQTSLDLSSSLGKESMVHAGFTSATGLNFASHDILYWEYHAQYSPVPSYRAH